MHDRISDAGVVIANPIEEKDEIAYDQMEKWITKALRDADKQAVSQKAVTPFILQRLFEVSGGKTLEANIALLKNNAKRAAQVAVSFSAMAL